MFSFSEGAPDGWDSARFSGIVLSYSSFPLPSCFLPSRRYRLLHLSSAKIKLLWFVRTGAKIKSADQDFALRADFLLPETIMFFFRECFATPVSL